MTKQQELQRGHTGASSWPIHHFITAGLLRLFGDGISNNESFSFCVHDAHRCAIRLLLLFRQINQLPSSPPPFLWMRKTLELLKV